jgi:hypothetical protein
MKVYAKEDTTLDTGEVIRTGEVADVTPKQFVENSETLKPVADISGQQSLRGVTGEMKVGEGSLRRFRE